MFYYSALFNQAQLHIESQPTALTPCFIKASWCTSTLLECWFIDNPDTRPFTSSNTNLTSQEMSTAYLCELGV